MGINRRILYATLLFALMVSVACTENPEEPDVANTPLIGPIVPIGAPEVRDLAPTSEVVPNCDGLVSPVVKHPSMTVGSAHSVEWQIGGSFGTGVTIGEGVVPAGIDLRAALEGHVANDINSSIQQSNAWDLPADPGTIMEYTVMWREVWQPAYVNVTFMNPEPEILRIDVRYRTRVQSEIVGDRVTLCESGTLSDTESAAVLPPTSSATGGSEPPISTISAGQLDSVFGEGNWFCFPDRNSGVGVKLLPTNFLVVAPLRYVDTFRGRFSVGETELGVTGATAELIGGISNDQCPAWQRASLTSWRTARSTGSQMTSGTRLSDIFGPGNWGCLADYAFGARIQYLETNLSIEYPFTSADANEYKYGVGEVVPAGSAITVWFDGSIPSSECP